MLESTMPVNHSTQILLDKLRKLVRKYIDKHHYQTALFWADKVSSLSNGETKDIYWLAQCLYLTKQFHRAALCIKNRNFHKVDLGCLYLAAKCHYAGKEYRQALDMLEQTNFRSNDQNDSLKAHEERKLESSIFLLKGQLYEAMDNRGLAAECFREALRLDVYCYEAFQSLVQHQMLSKEEEQELLQSLPFSKHCSEKEEAELVKFLYQTQLKKYDQPLEFVIPNELNGLKGNLDLATVMAERCYYNCDYQQCFSITSEILNGDPYHNQCLPIHISCLMELKKSNALFYLAHKLVDLYPEGAIAWFAVGCYYLLINKTDTARRYLSKATTLDCVFGPAWLMYGHSFAVENEHDQAMAAYFKASQLMKGCHLPLLYIGLEYGLTNNTKLAERFFNQALTIAPEDPFVLHELGVVAFQSQDYVSAEKYFREALEKVQTSGQTVLPEKWEPLLNNLGHTCRKIKKYEEALEFHQQALVLAPQNPSSLSAIGYVHSLMKNWALAVEYFHKALGLQKDDTFSTSMLTYVIENLMNVITPCEDVPEELPSYELSLLSHSVREESGHGEGPSETSMSISIEVEMEEADQ